MPRLARKYLESSFVHIIVQGLDRQYIFKGNFLKSSYRTILKKNISETNIELISYCIMDNHSHLLLYGEDFNDISKIMHKTNTSYAKLYNKTQKRVGYVFRDRYFVQPISNEKQLFNCIAYIHKNPINAGIVKLLSSYNYSSYNEYIDIDKRFFISSNAIKLVFGSSEDYLNLFHEIHKFELIEDIKDIVEKPQNPESIICEYLQNTCKSLSEIKLNKQLLGELLVQLRYSGRFIPKGYISNLAY